MKQLLFLLVFSASSVFAQNPILWHFDTQDAAFGNAASADLDNDGKLEIVFSTYRNDGMVYALNGEDGSLLWSYNTGGCNDVAPLIYDVDKDGDLEVVVPGSCNPTTFCFDGATGNVEWSTPTHGSDSPPTIADLDDDGNLEILHGEFGGYVLCINAEDGTVAWNIAVDLQSWIQTAPAILDVNSDGQLDFVVATWHFDTTHVLYAYDGLTKQQIWTSHLPNDVMYHGVAFADIDSDNKPELLIGDYSGQMMAINAEDASLLWSYSVPNPFYIGAPVSIGDLDGDGDFEIVMLDAWELHVLDHLGNKVWSQTIPNFGQAFRGAALADIDNDSLPDITIGTGAGSIHSFKGTNGNPLYTIDLEAHYGQDFDIDHGPLIADFDQNGVLDVFVQGGHAEYPNIQNNYGRAYLVELGVGSGPDWLMFRHDEKRSGCLCEYHSMGLSTAENLNPATTFNIAPNPSTGSFSLETNSIGESLKIYNMMGARLYETEINSPQQNISLNLPPGVYLIKMGNITEMLEIIE